MTIRFAAAWGGATPAIARALCLSAPLGAANDNRPSTPLRRSNRPARPANSNCDGHDQVLAEALRHFARHGLGAAVKACEEAEQADACGDSDSREQWLSICRHFDRRMADACARNFSQDA
ncbi:hypothetical protein [Novosphingobium malaysiense]|uniref:Uncharacterized protein n=1 Tax=Novosphingobium malaysiense TaxID=1348853 RepID=A0A0B1ZVI1_9SPHN|nr:hypothetical protein [Novosphingobium malaysiense]KHK93137.1 hypothetical protein LK12_01990 [Novosphingobium malaysiense]